MKIIVAVATLCLTVACQQQAPQEAAVPPPAPVSAQESEGVQTADLKISGGEYQPASLTVRAGVPLRLNVTRDEKPGCGDVLTIPSQNISRPIPVNQVTQIEFTPQEAGELEFTCGMNMMRGKIVVQ
ncbi:MAG TPA: cupredoxin domain-containing protein [Thermoanaerobaculia bacterium]|nr:cupredoxin domain-containing protein [Thermoanaerobaculia bacterium]